MVGGAYEMIRAPPPLAVDTYREWSLKGNNRMVAWNASTLNALADEYDLTDDVDTARMIVDEALAEGKIRTQNGTVKSSIDGYRDLNLAATGASQYYDTKAGHAIRFGDDELDDRRIHAAIWVVYKNTEPPESVKRARMVNAMNSTEGKVSVSRTLRVSMAATREISLTEAAKAVNEWWDHEGEREHKRRVDQAKKSLATLANSGVLPPEVLAAAMAALQQQEENESKDASLESGDNQITVMGVMNAITSSDGDKDDEERNDAESADPEALQEQKVGKAKK